MYKCFGGEFCWWEENKMFVTSISKVHNCGRKYLKNIILNETKSIQLHRMCIGNTYVYMKLTSITIIIKS